MKIEMKVMRAEPAEIFSPILYLNFNFVSKFQFSVYLYPNLAIFVSEFEGLYFVSKFQNGLYFVSQFISSRALYRPIHGPG